MYRSAKKNHRQQKLTSVVNGRASVAEELDGGVSTHAELGGQIALHGGVDHAELDLRALLLQHGGGLGKLRGQGLAVAAPWGV